MEVPAPATPSVKACVLNYDFKKLSYHNSNHQKVLENSYYVHGSHNQLNKQFVVIFVYSR